MQVSGKLLVVATVAISMAMAVGAWWHRYAESRRAAKFWGSQAALLVGDSRVSLAELGEPDADAAAATPGEILAGRLIVASTDLTERQGLIHLRHALTYDANFDWSQRRATTLADGPAWRRALRFADDDRELVVLFTADFDVLGKLEPDRQRLSVLPCPRLGPVVLRYLADLGVAQGASAAR